METVWFISLISSICLEGMGRKYLPQIPGFLFYFLKDIILVLGYLRFRPSAAIRGTARYLYRGFEIAWIVSFVWTVIELFNPAQSSAVLGLIGIRSYWVWWMAPVVIAGVLMKRRTKEDAIYALLAMTMIVAVVAAMQFASPADSSLNMYQVQNGEEIHASDMAVVASTGRARVASTFTFLSGFVAFTILVPTILLSIGLDSTNPRIRALALVGTSVSAAVIPMSGSRSAIVLGILVLVVTMWAGGLFFTRLGRRVLIGGIVAGVLSVGAFPEAFFGVESRFDNADETVGRFKEVFDVLPPVALFDMEYPVMGIGTGMQQNARFQLHVDSDWYAEGEYNRYLIELGPVGYLFFWIARFGLAVGLLRGYALLKRAGRRGSAGAALSYAAITMFGNQTFDHNWQALYFLGCGFILADIHSVRQQLPTLMTAGRVSTDPSAAAGPDLVTA
jgi:hypothetical protein